ncbi:MAG TPA: sigma-70 family RNA polymerase sigma factor [Gemmataceae bacterium]|nr:sigma-70 family RNA polymerase sigma factor [Gemmataceae bacterium]
MSEQDTFRVFIQRIQAGDDRAAAELVQYYEPTLRVVVRRRLTDPRLRRLFDSMDICQSVLATFFVGAAAGQFKLDTPENLIKLLATMARNKLTSWARRHGAARRKPSGRSLDLQEPIDTPASGPTPSQVVANQDLLREFLKRLSPEERRIQELHAAGKSWQEIADQLGGTPAALRMELQRAFARVKKVMGLED